MKVLLIDAYDSFVYVIDQYLKSLGLQVDVVRNDAFDILKIANTNYDALVLGPGPGHPKDSGYLELLAKFANTKPILGVCLGMQAMALHYGAEVTPAQHLMHGKTSAIEHNSQGCFTNLPNPLTVTRYHSLIATADSLQHTQLEVTATAQDDGYVMALAHKNLPIAGVQFHPESITSTKGLEVFRNFFEHAARIPH